MQASVWLVILVESLQSQVTDLSFLLVESLQFHVKVLLFLLVERIGLGKIRYNEMVVCGMVRRTGAWE